MPTIPIKTNIEGKINNMPDFKRHALFPVYEAVVNSIQAIEERGNLTNGQITIEIIREQGIPDKERTDRRTEPIKSFYIEDNGIGFNDKNFDSFLTAESTYKLEKGGKGVGRFYWLKAFDNIEIESVYSANGKNIKRHFNFTKTPGNEIALMDDDGSESNGHLGTIVRLNGFKNEYRTVVTAYKTGEKIAQRIFEYILSYYIGKAAPKIIVNDGETSYILDNFFDKIESDEELIKIENILFTLTHLKIPSTYRNVHNIVLCANNRDVLTESLQKYIGTTYQLEDEKGKKFYYAIYVSSPYLDKNVNCSRLFFDLPTGSNLDIIDDSSIMDKQISIDKIKKEAIQRSKENLSKYLIDVNEKKHELVSEYIKFNPSVRAVPKYCPEIYDEIQINSTPDSINEVIYLHKGKAELNIQKKHDKLLGKRFDNLLDIKEETKKLTTEIEDFTKDSLVGYILYRKKIIDLLESNLEKDKDGNFKYEKIIHDIIFPMRTSSDEIDIENLNLWLIDELLISHQFAQSDRKLNKYSSSDSEIRPDVFICCEKEPDNTARSVSIIEFKRPGGESKDDPVTQLFNDMDQIKKDGGVDFRKTGRLIHVGDNTRYYCYAICDINDVLKNSMKRYGFSQLKDNLGYSVYNPDYKASVQVMAFDKLLADVKTRHSIFLTL